MQALSRPSFPGIVCALLVFGGCAGERRPEAGANLGAGSDYAGKTLAVVLPDSGATDLENAAALANSLLHEFPGPSTETSRAALAREFGNGFWSGFAPAIDYVTPIRVPDSVPPAPADRRVRAAPANDRRPTHTYSAPDSAWLAEHGVKADLVLAVGPLKVSHEEEEIQSFQFGGSITTHRIRMHGWYLIWDYAKARAIAQGPLDVNLPYRGQLRARDWMKAFDQAVETVGNASPFRGPKWFRR